MLISGSVEESSIATKKLEKLGDVAGGLKKHDEAIGYYSSALSLNPTSNDLSQFLWTPLQAVYDQTQQVAVFPEVLIYNELRCPNMCMVEQGSHRREVEAFYRYVSHRWDSEAS
ncbi:hypothetical protein HD554DRAFT_2325999 [Boletus coccyginus]|nr:hypothetical protein HD554DRAFT_2325999 [Boletus coccyginus]